MPLTHTRSFRVRHSELDAFGQVKDAVYLRYMQETAFEASAGVGYDTARYAAMQRLWLIHDTAIEYRQPMRESDCVHVTTWVADFSRVQSRRCYEFKRAGAEAVLATAHSDWAFLDAVTGRPVPIPPELAAAFWPAGEGSPSLKRERFPEPPPATHPFSLQRRVDWRDVDAAGHVNNANYLDYAIECMLQALAAQQWPLQRWEAEGVRLAARHHRLEYKQSAVYGDELQLSTWLRDVTPDSLTRYVHMTRMSDGALIARAILQYGCVALATQQPGSLPAPFIAEVWKRRDDGRG
jgi:acyl-CoA thioester hydrolase